MECELCFSLSPGQGAGLAGFPRSESLAKCHPSSRGGDGVAPEAPGQTSEECCMCWLLAAKAQSSDQRHTEIGKGI